MNAQSKIEAHAGLYASLAKAQAAMTAPSKNREVSVKMKTGGSYKFKYATLDHLIEHVRGPLTENGLWFVQMTEPGQMVTRIVHESGEFVDSSVPMPNLPNAPQEAGSVLTYFRRYSLSVALGLASDEDDDANVAEGNGYEARDRNSRSSDVISETQWGEITSLIEATSADVKAFCTAYKCASVKELPASAFTQARDQLRRKLARMKEAEDA